MGKPVVHFEVAGPDHAASATFFAELFGWEVVSSSPELFYSTVDTRSLEGINGGFGSPPNSPPYVAVYAAVDDLQATLDQAESLGAKTLMGVTEIPNIVTMAMFADPAGNFFGLVNDGPGPTYWMVDTGAGRGTNGGMGSSINGQAQVNVYAHVDDLQKYVEVAESAGGTTIVPPMKVSDTLSIAHVADPHGARFGLYVGM